MIVQPDFLDHWKTSLLVEILDDPCAPLYVIRLWAHCQNRKTHGFRRVNPSILKAICKAPHDAVSFENAMVQSGFVEISDGNIMAHDWDRVNATLIANWENGKKGGRPRKKNPSKTHGLPMANPDVTDKRREEKIEKNNIPPKPPKGGYTEEFLQFWAAYPRKIGKSAAFKAWKRIKDRPKLAQLIKAVQSAMKTEQWNRNNGKYVPHPATWLNQRRWEDEGYTPTTTAKEPPTDAEIYRAWLNLGEYGFEDAFGISHIDFADRIRRDLADMKPADFGSKYKRRAQDAREDVNG